MTSTSRSFTELEGRLLSSDETSLTILVMPGARLMTVQKATELLREWQTTPAGNMIRVRVPESEAIRAGIITTGGAGSQGPSFSPVTG